MATARLGILLFFFAFLVFVADGRLPEGKTDSVASRTIPFSILGSGSLYLDPVRDVAIDMFKPDWRWWSQKTRTGTFASLYPIVTLYIPAVAYLAVAGWVQYVGAFHYNANSDRLIHKDDRNWIPVFANAWNPAHTPFIVEFRNERQPANLLTYLGRL